MKKPRLVSAGMICLFAISFTLRAQDSPSEFETELQALEQTTPLPASEMPDNAQAIYSVQHPDWPPLPNNWLNLSFWALGNGVYAIDDRAINYSELAQAAQAQALPRNGKFGTTDGLAEDLLLTPANIGFSIAQQTTNIVLKWQSASNRIYMVEQRPTLTGSSYWTELANYVLSASATNITSLVLTNLIQQQPIDFFRLFDVTPVANDDFFAIDQDSSANQLDIFQNDVDPNGDPIFISNLVPAHHGDISYSLDATTFQYTPTAGFYGIDTFQYSITSDYGDVSSNATVKVFVNKTGNNSPVAPEIDITLPTNTYTATFNAITNATDSDGDTISLYAVASPTLGSVSNDASGNIYYTRNPNLFGNDSFSYIVTDGNGGYGEGSVKISQVDSDGDRMPDQWEMKYGLDPTTDDSANDPDGDGLPNLAEFVLGTNPNVPDNPLNLSVITNGIELSGLVHIPILGLSPALAQTPPITFYVNGATAAHSTIQQGADGQWYVKWDTSFLTNGNYDIQVSVQYNPIADITLGQTNEAFSATKTVQVNNPITFDALTTTFGNDLYITGTLADTNDTFDVYLYDPDGDLLVYATNVFAPNGQIGLAWDLTDGNGNQISFGNVQAVFYLHPTGIQPEGESSGGSSGLSHWYLKDTMTVNATTFAIAWGWDSYAYYLYNWRTELMQNGVINILGNPADDFSYFLLPAANAPFAGTAFRFDDDADESILMNFHNHAFGSFAHSGNFFWLGHGAPTFIAGNPDKTWINTRDVAVFLGNTAYDPEAGDPINNSHPYSLVILNGCQTYSSGWASAWGIDPTPDDYNNYSAVGRQPRAFVGWTKLIAVPGAANDFFYDGLLDEEYGNCLAILFENWMQGYPINYCVELFGSSAVSTEPHYFQNQDSWNISGCVDMEIYDQ